jgi:hypothetical protein
MAPRLCSGPLSGCTRAFHALARERIRRLHEFRKTGQRNCNSGRRVLLRSGRSPGVSPDVHAAARRAPEAQEGRGAGSDVEEPVAGLQLQRRDNLLGFVPGGPTGATVVASANATPDGADHLGRWRSMMPSFASIDSDQGSPQWTCGSVAPGGQSYWEQLVYGP